MFFDFIRKIVFVCFVLGIQQSVDCASAEEFSPSNLRPKIIDENTINTLNGHPYFRTDGVSVGSLEFYRFYLGTQSVPNRVTSRWRDSVTGAISSQGDFYFVTVGELEAVFQRNGNSYTEVFKNGESLAYNAALKRFSYVRSDGTIYDFDIEVPVGAGSRRFVNDYDEIFTTPFWADEAMLRFVRMPDGETIEYHYFRKPADGNEYYRLQSITSNRGHFLHFEYMDPDGPPRDSSCGILCSRTDTSGPDAPRHYLHIDNNELNPEWFSLKKVVALNRDIELNLTNCLPLDTVCSGIASHWPVETYEGPSSYNELYDDNRNYYQLENYTNSDGKTVDFTHNGLHEGGVGNSNVFRILCSTDLLRTASFPYAAGENAVQQFSFGYDTNIQLTRNNFSSPEYCAISRTTNGGFGADYTYTESARQNVGSISRLEKNIDGLASNELEIFESLFISTGYADFAGKHDIHYKKAYNVYRSTRQGDRVRVLSRANLQWR